MGRAIVITSGKGGVGKTTTVANLGTALARQGKNVVLVDADIGLRNLDVVMGLENRIVYHVVDVTPAQGEGDKNITDFLVNSQRDGLYAAFIGGLRDQAGLKSINQQALAQVLGLDQPAQ